MPKTIRTEQHAEFVALFVDARLDAGLSQTELGLLVGKGQKFISQIETGERRVDVLEFYMFARVLKLDPLAFYGNLIKRLPKRFEI